MAKIIDITEKLNFEQKPQIKIKDTTVTVNNEAVAMLKIIPKMNGNVTPEAINEICKTLFESSELKKLQNLNLNFSDFVKVIETATELVVGDVELGETEIPAMT